MALTEANEKAWQIHSELERKAQRASEEAVVAGDLATRERSRSISETWDDFAVGWDLNEVPTCAVES